MKVGCRSAFLGSSSCIVVIFLINLRIEKLIRPIYAEAGMKNASSTPTKIGHVDRVIYLLLKLTNFSGSIQAHNRKLAYTLKKNYEKALLFSLQFLLP